MLALFGTLQVLYGVVWEWFNMAWSFNSVGTVTTSATTTLTPALPSTYNAGNLLLLVISAASDITQVLSGWTNIAYSYDSGSDTALACWYKFATASESSPSITLLAPDGSTGVILAYSSILSYNNASPVRTNSLTTAGTTNAQTLSATASTNNSLVISVFGCPALGANTNTISFSTPTGTTLRASLTSTGSGTAGKSAYPAILVVDENQSAAGTTTSRTSVITKVGTTSTISRSIVFAINQDPNTYTTNLLSMF